MVDTLNLRNTFDIQPRSDMDLIDILWRQDMDLGVGREVFDPNLRRDLEKEKELELMKQREQEQLEKLKEEEKQNDEPPQQDVSYMVDGETGELVPIATQQPPEQQPSRELAQLDDTDEGWSVEEAVRFLEEQNRDDETMVPAINIQPRDDVDDLDVGREIETFIQNAQQMLQQDDVSQQQQQPASVQPLFRTQESFEAALDEVVSLLDMPSLTDASLNDNNDMIDHGICMIDNNMNMIDDNTDSPLISNTTMTAYNPEYDLIQQPQQEHVAMGEPFTPLTAFTNSTLGLPGQDSSVFNFTQDLNMFTNITNLTGTGQLNDTDFQHTQSLLRQLMEDDPLGDMMDTTPPFDNKESSHRREDSVSSDSAVSSMGSCSPLGDVSDTLTTLSEALEGATGGGEYDNDNKFESKYSPHPDRHSYSDFDSLSNGNSMNFSGSNDSDPSRSPSNVGDLRRYVKHNHTYPLQPGQQPRESKTKMGKDENKIATNRDERRAKELKIPFSTDDIIHSPVERFNEMLQKYHLTESQLQLVKDIRRRGKNKVAAQNCRKRKIEALSTIEEDIEDLKKQRDKLVNDKGLIDKELKDFKEKMSQLYNEVLSSLRDDDGQPYDPSQYSLQQTADGSIILVPRNSTAAANGDASDEKTPTQRRRKGRKN